MCDVLIRFLVDSFFQGWFPLFLIFRFIWNSVTIIYTMVIVQMHFIFRVDLMKSLWRNWMTLFSSCWLFLCFDLWVIEFFFSHPQPIYGYGLPSFLFIHFSFLSLPKEALSLSYWAWYTNSWDFFHICLWRSFSRCVFGYTKYVTIRSARNILLVSNLFYFGTCGCLIHCHGGVFEIHHTSCIE
jgi:hypothetical protein